MADRKKNDRVNWIDTQPPRGLGNPRRRPEAPGGLREASGGPESPEGPRGAPGAPGDLGRPRETPREPGGPRRPRGAPGDPRAPGGARDPRQFRNLLADSSDLVHLHSPFTSMATKTYMCDGANKPRPPVPCHDQESNDPYVFRHPECLRPSRLLSHIHLTITDSSYINLDHEIPGPPIQC